MYMWLSWFLCAADCLIMSQWFSLRSQQCSTVSEHHIEKREGNSAQVPVNMQISTREEKTFQLQRHTMWCFLFLTPPSWWTCGHGEEVAAAPLILLVAFVGQPQEGSVAATVPKDGASSSDSGASLPPPARCASHSARAALDLWTWASGAWRLRRCVTAFPQATTPRRTMA
jgi:hypothetical protein